MQYQWNHDIYFSTTYYLQVYDTTYKTLVRSHPAIVTVAYKSEYIPPNKVMELERNLSLNLSNIHPIRSLETHERFHTEKSFRNLDMVILNIHSVAFTNLGEYMIAYISVIPWLYQ